MEESTKKFFKDLAKAAFKTGKVIAPPIMTATIYNKIFGHRIETPIGLTYQLEDFEGLLRVRHVFKTNDKRNLVGYMYFHKNSSPKALIVFAHGFGGGGQTSYMDIIDYLASQNFCVFAYDATGNDESEGQGMNGFPQAVIDLENAIKYTRTLNPYNKLPLVLFGHSMGAYSVSNVLNFYHDVKCVVAASGFNKSSEIVLQHAAEFDKEQGLKVAPYIDDFEESKFGKYASSTSVEGFKSTAAKILVIHSEDDPVIPISSGFDIYYKEFKSNPRFSFIKLKESGHGTVFYSKDGIKYSKKINADYKANCKSEYFTDDLKIQFRDKTVDRNKYCNMIDIKLFSKIIKFINNSI